MKIQQVIDYLNQKFIPAYQESYDNSGFLVGDPDNELTGVLTTTDVTPAVIDEAIALGLNLIVSHHPMIFSGVKRISPANETGRMIIRLLQNGVAVYAAHTNLDNLATGVNGILAEKIGLNATSILRPLRDTLAKVVTYVPTSHADAVRDALFNAGAGSIGAYDRCSFNSDGFGTFRAGDNCHPFCGTPGITHQEPETRIEAIYERRNERRLLAKLRQAHPYEEPAIDCLPLSNSMPSVGAGMIGSLPQPMPAAQFLANVKSRLSIPVVRTTHCDGNTSVSKVAICGGSGSFLIGDAIAAGADIYLTADLKYHDFQSAENNIILADIGHFESEQFAKELFLNTISQKFGSLPCRVSNQDNGFIDYR